MVRPYSLLWTGDQAQRLVAFGVDHLPRPRNEFKHPHTVIEEPIAGVREHDSPTCAHSEARTLVRLQFAHLR